MLVPGVEAGEDEDEDEDELIAVALGTLVMLVIDTVSREECCSEAEAIPVGVIAGLEVEELDIVPSEDVPDSAEADVLVPLGEFSWLVVRGG